jgi:hypothetical protein
MILLNSFEDQLMHTGSKLLDTKNTCITCSLKKNVKKTYRILFQEIGRTHLLLVQGTTSLVQLSGKATAVLLDPDPHGSALILVGCTRIRILEGKNDPQK